MAGLDTIKAIIEALRGGNTDHNKALAARASMTSSSNPMGLDQQGSFDNPITSEPMSHYQMSAGLRDSKYLDYVKQTQKPKPYTEWLEGGD